MNDPTSRIRDLERRVSNILRLGTIATLDEAAARVTVKIGELVTAPLPWLTQRAGPDRSWWAPEPGEQVLVLAPGGELSIGVVLPAIYQTAHPAPANAKTKHRTQYADGTFVEYDRAAHKLTASVQGAADIVATGNVNVTAGGTAKLESAGALTLKGSSIALQGPVTANSTIVASGDVTGQGISLKNHVHGGVTPGPGSTAPPT